MLRASIPTRFQLAWAKNAGGPYIRNVPVASQIGIQDGAASFNDGFVPDNMTPLAGGGVPPFGQDINGVLNVTTSWDQWYQAVAPISFDTTFSTAIGGYPQGSLLDSTLVTGRQWASLVDNNTTDPDDPLTSTNWRAVGIPPGMPMPFLTSTLPADFVPMNALTIGNAGSNATALANAAAIFLYAFVWLNFSNTQCPILTSGGGASTRGANPYADFAALKQLTMPSAKGFGFIGADTMGGAASNNLLGVPVTIGNRTTPGSILGETFHVLTVAELALHNHGITDPSHTHANTLNDPSHSHVISPAAASFGGGPAGITTGGVAAALTSSVSATQTASTGVTISNVSSSTGISTNNNGANNGHNSVQLSMIVYWGLKL